MRTVALIGVPTTAGAFPAGEERAPATCAAGPGELLAGAGVSRATTATATSGVAPHRKASVAAAARLTTGRDDEHERRIRLLLLSKGAVLAHWFHRPLAAGMDDDQ